MPYLYKEERDGDDDLRHRRRERRRRLRASPGAEDAIDPIGSRQQRRVDDGETDVEPYEVETTEEVGRGQHDAKHEHVL